MSCEACAPRAGASAVALAAVSRDLSLTQPPRPSRRAGPASLAEGVTLPIGTQVACPISAHATRLKLCWCWPGVAVCGPADVADLRPSIPLASLSAHQHVSPSLLSSFPLQPSFLERFLYDAPSQNPLNEEFPG